MITLDKIKIVSPAKNIEITDLGAFDIISNKGIINSYKYTRLSPDLMYVEVSTLRNELIIEFTGKILKEEYPSLINKNNIVKCLKNINELNICNLDIHSIIQDSQVVKIDITKDVCTPTPCKELTTQMQASIANFKKYRTTTIKDNFIIEKNVRTKGYKNRLTIYDKYKELQRAENKAFISSIDNKDELLAKYKNKIRFEMNCNSKEQIRKALNIADLSLYNVLNAQANPIWEFLDKVIADTPVSTLDQCNLKELMQAALLQQNDYDIEKIEATIRAHCSPKTNIQKTMQPFRTLLNKLKNTNTPSLKATLQTLLLLEITIALFVIT